MNEAIPTRRREGLGVAEGSLLLDCSQVQLAVSREGRGPAVVCLHAIGHGARDFDAFSLAIKDRYEVIRIDWPGHGRSGPDTERLSAQRYAELLVQALDQLDITSPIVVGNSIGGAAAILYAARRPLRALVLCDSGGLVRVSGLVRGFTRVFARFFRAGERGAPWFRSVFSWYYRYVVLPSKAAAAQRQRIIDSVSETAPLLRAAWESFGRSDADLRTTAATLDVPIWCAWAKGDRVIPLWMCRPAIRRLRRAKLSTFKGGHSAFLEQPDAFTLAFRQFADALGSIPVPAPLPA